MFQNSRDCGQHDTEYHRRLSRAMLQTRNRNLTNVLVVAVSLLSIGTHCGQAEIIDSKIPAEEKQSAITAIVEFVSVFPEYVKSGVENIQSAEGGLVLKVPVKVPGTHL